VGGIGGFIFLLALALLLYYLWLKVIHGKYLVKEDAVIKNNPKIEAPTGIKGEFD